MSTSKPFLPSDLVRRPAGDALAKAALAHGLAYARNDAPLAVAKALWANDRAAVDLVERAVSASATTGTLHWASELATTALTDFVASLGPSSAASAIFGRALQLSFGTSNSITVPNMAAVAGNTAWVGEGAVIPVMMLSTADTSPMVPRKLASIVIFTREIIEHSSALPIVRDALTRAVGLAMDSTLLDAAAASSTRPQGLRNGVSALTASTATPLSEALADDVANLLSAIAGTLGNDTPVLVAAAGQAARLKLALRGPGAPLVLASPGLADGVAMAIAPQALAVATDRAPSFSQVTEAVIHMEDTSPLGITTAAVATSVKSLWQTDSIGIKLIMNLDWQRRATAGVAWVSGTSW